MTKILISAKHGTDDPVLATLPYIAAMKAKELGHQPIIWLWHEATSLARQGAATYIMGANIKPLKEVLPVVLELGIPIWICRGCAEARGVAENNVIANTSFKEMPDFIEALASCDRNVEF